MDESQQHKKSDELFEVVLGVLLCGFAVVAVAVLLTMQVSSVFAR
ncbi:MAG: hypothetical protein WEE03_12000 [Chloroflexota bacterium]